MIDQPVCVISGLVAGYGAESVLRGVDLELERGSMTGLLGRNGAGKTTLMRAMLGLIETRGGEATLFGEPAFDAPAAVRKRLGYVPQEFAGLGMRKVREVVQATSAFYDSWDAEATSRRQAEWALDEQAMNQLSVGQRQKVAILLALGHKPDLLVLDEPVASLDPAARREFLQQLVTMNVDQEQTVLLSSHITSDIERIASHVAILHEGRIVLHESLELLREQVRLVTFADEVPVHPAVLARATGVRAWVRCEPEVSLPGAVSKDPFQLEDFFLDITRSRAAL